MPTATIRSLPPVQVVPARDVASVCVEARLLADGFHALADWLKARPHVTVEAVTVINLWEPGAPDTWRVDVFYTK